MGLKERVKKTRAWRAFRTFVEGVVYAGIPDRIYDFPMQRERIGWLKKNRTGKTLEVGSGTGIVLDRTGGQVGLELSQRRVEIAAKKFPHLTFVQGDATKMPFKTGEYETVMLPEILEHVPFEVAKKIVAESLRVANKQVLITLPNAAKKDYDVDLVENPEHLWMPTPEKVGQLTGAKHKIEYDSGQNFLLVPCTKAGGRAKAKKRRK